MVSHPYIPQDLILDGFVQISTAQITVLGVYLSSSFLVASFIWLVSGWCAKLSQTERLIMCWLAFSGLNHIILETYFVFSPEFYKDSSFLADVWKIYSLGDSRYAARESSLVTLEILTVFFVGPSCLLAVYAIAKRKSYSDILQISISLGHLYAVALFYVTSFLQGNNFASSPFYYYSYIVLGNSFWICIPILIIIRSWKEICAAVLAASHSRAPTQKKNKTG
ncbi:hypothetical protein MKW94_014821 [Papaver nudicaule]|uniref:EXPERA domain-containing protein n=1 Tax=Papaver nudicaule TaxID=74823 RepID=A0AA41VI25_PAPNU|nr:hypothetical protein [Papaver nudicaule]